MINVWLCGEILIWHSSLPGHKQDAKCAVLLLYLTDKDCFFGWTVLFWVSVHAAFLMILFVNMSKINPIDDVAFLL